MRITASAAFPLFTDRLMLRELAIGDASLMADWACDMAYYKYLHVGVLDEAVLNAQVNDAIECQQHDPRESFTLGVVDKSNGALVGTARVVVADRFHREGIVGYGIAPDHWGKGFAVEAMLPLIDFAFLALGLNRLNAICDADNIASHKVAEKLGFVKEGVLRRHRRVETEDGGDVWRDTVLYAALR